MTIAAAPASALPIPPIGDVLDDVARRARDEFERFKRIARRRYLERVLLLGTLAGVALYALFRDQRTH